MGKDVNVLLKHLVVQVYCTGCSPCLLAKTNSGGRREENEGGGGRERREEKEGGNLSSYNRMYTLTAYSTSGLVGRAMFYF